NGWFFKMSHIRSNSRKTSLGSLPFKNAWHIASCHCCTFSCIRMEFHLSPCNCFRKHPPARPLERGRLLPGPDRICGVCLFRGTDTNLRSSICFRKTRTVCGPTPSGALPAFAFLSSGCQRLHSDRE